MKPSRASNAYKKNGQTHIQKALLFIGILAKCYI